MSTAPSIKDILLRSFEAIPTKVSRAHIEGAVCAYLRTHATENLEERAQLFADDVVAEDPVGGATQHGKAELIAFWKATIGIGWKVDSVLERIVVSGDEAMAVFTSRLNGAGSGAADLRVFETLSFNEQGQIYRLRAFFDASCLS